MTVWIVNEGFHQKKIASLPVILKPLPCARERAFTFDLPTTATAQHQHIFYIVGYT
jgi:hypothetical protein